MRKQFIYSDKTVSRPMRSVAGDPLAEFAECSVLWFDVQVVAKDDRRRDPR